MKNKNDLLWRYLRNKRLEELLKTFKNFLNFELLKENPNIPQKFLPNYNGKKASEGKEIMQNLTKEKERAEMRLKQLDMGDN